MFNWWFRLVFLVLLSSSYLAGQASNPTILLQGKDAQAGANLPNANQTQAVSTEAAIKMENKLREGENNRVYVFNRLGGSVEQVPLTSNMLERYPSLIDLLKSSSSPISHCEDPKPLPPPPPGCVVCKSGKIVCAKGFKTGK
jgi:hypothetical protein